MNYYISHSAKGHTWENHKYVKKIGNRYYYKDDLARGAKKANAEALERYNMRKAAEDPDYALYYGGKALANKIKAAKLDYEQKTAHHSMPARIQYKTLNGSAKLIEKGRKKINWAKFNTTMKAKSLFSRKEKV